jgi:regulator of replication initiation timing
VSKDAIAELEQRNAELEQRNAEIVAENAALAKENSRLHGLIAEVRVGNISEKNGLEAQVRVLKRVNKELVEENEELSSREMVIIERTTP